jgi:hypothetical protein
MPKGGRVEEDDTRGGSKARAAKAAAAAAKDAAAKDAAERAEAAAWADGADSRRAAKAAEAERAAAEKAAKKAAAAAQLAAEEEEAKNGRKLRGADKVAARKAQAVASHGDALDRLTAPALEARNIDDALAVLTIAATGDDDAAAAVAAGAGTPGAAAAVAAGDDAHPEKRMKAAFTRYRERELPLLKAEYPSLRMSQLLEMLKRAWDRSPENPVVAAERAKAATAGSWKAAGGGTA